MNRIFTLTMMFAVMSKTTGWKQRIPHDFHHHHNDWHKAEGGHFPPHNGEHGWHHHGDHNWDESNKPQSWGHHWGHDHHPPCHHHKPHDWGSNHGKWGEENGHWGSNHGKWGGENGHWGGNHGDGGWNNGNWGSHHPDMGENNGNWGGNNADGGENNGNWGDNHPNGGDNIGNGGANGDDGVANNKHSGASNVNEGEINGNWGFIGDNGAANNGHWGSNDDDLGGNNSNSGSISADWGANNNDSDSSKSEGDIQNTDSNWQVVQRSTPDPSETYPSPATDLPEPTNPNPTSSSPISTTQLPSSTSQNPTSFSPISTTQMPSSTSQSSLSSTSSQSADACRRSCLVTTEYQPVCGTDYQTYRNMGLFRCAQACGADIKIFLRRVCPSLDTPTTARTVLSNGLTGLAAVRYSAVQCISSCTFTDEDNPVCGTDNITYDNPSMLLCAQRCGYGVEIKSMSACSEVNSVTSRNDLLQTTAIPYAVKSCINSCTFSSEYNPVCGTNGVTYQNPSQLNCASLCGIDVEILQRSPCSGSTTNNGNFNNNLVTTTTTTTTTTTAAPTPSSAQVAACMLSCPQTPEYNPVCGTNGVTYKNPGHLSCAQACGTSVQLKRNSACPKPTVTQSPTQDNPPVNPLTNQQPPIIPSTTSTAEFTIDINGPVNGADIITIPPTQSPNVNDSNPPDSSTIPPDILLSVFTQTAPTTTTERDEEFDLDPRYGEKDKQGQTQM